MSYQLQKGDLRWLQEKGIAFPKSGPKPKATICPRCNRTKQSGRGCRSCGWCPPAKPRKPIKRTALKRSHTPIAQMSPERRRRVNGWKAIREAIQERDNSLCYWCGIQHADRGGTAEHAWPRVHAQEDKETNLLWVGSWACHRAKEQQTTSGEVKGLRLLLLKYPVAGPSPEQTNDAIERNLLVLALKAVQRDIEAGRRPSLLAGGKGASDARA